MFLIGWGRGGGGRLGEDGFLFAGSAEGFEGWDVLDVLGVLDYLDVLEVLC